MTSKTLRLGIVGMGPHFQQDLFPALLRARSRVNFELTAFCDISHEARKWAYFSAGFNGKVISSKIKDSPFWNSIDCVLCNSRPRVHEIVLRQAIRRGIHCLCEKPVALDAEHLGRVIPRKAPHDIVIRIGHVFRYRHGGRAFIEALTRTKPKSLVIQYAGAGPKGKRWGYSCRKAFALTHLTHAIDFIVASTGRILEVRNVTWSPKNSPDIAVTATLKTERCPAVTLWATNGARAFRMDALAVLDSGAQVRMEDLDSVYITGLPEDGKRSGPFTEPDALANKQDAFRDEIVDFLQEVQGQGKCLLPGLEEGYHITTIVDYFV